VLRQALSGQQEVEGLEPGVVAEHDLASIPLAEELGDHRGGRVVGVRVDHERDVLELRDQQDHEPGDRGGCGDREHASQ
jgi:hypothetical protein